MRTFTKLISLWLNFKGANSMKIAVVSLLLLLMSSGVWGQSVGDYRTNATGTWNWTTSANWQRCVSNGSWAGATSTSYPGQNAGAGLVTIQNNTVVQVTSVVLNSIGSLSIPTGNQISYVDIQSAGSLSVSGATTLNANSDNDYKYVKVSGLFTSGSFSTTGGGDLRDAFLEIATGTVTITGNITMNTGSALRNYILFSGNGVLNIGGGFVTNGYITSTAGGSATAPTMGTVNYTNAAQTVWPTTYNNLTLSGSGAKTTSSVTVNGILSMEGTATASALPTYVASSTIQYKGASLQTTGVEFPTTFNGAGGVVIDNNSGVIMSGNHTVSNALTLTNGAFSIGANTLTLNGSVPNCGTIVGGASSNLTIGGAVANTNLPSVTLNNLTLNRANGVTLCGAVTVNNILTLTSGNISLSNYDLTLGTSATIVGSFDGAHMIETNGTGSLVKQSTTAGGFNITYPVGVGALYNPMILSGMTGSPVSTATVSVRAASGHAINTSTTDLNKYWVVSSSNLGLTSTNISFKYINPNDVSGTQSEYALRYSTTPADVWNTPNAPSSASVNPLTTTGSTVLDGTWTARETSVTWYSLRTGNWNDPTVWTLDPAGSLINNPGNTYPQSILDNVVVKNGRTITMNLSTVTCKNLTVEGTLDLASTTGHTFTTINGNGRILLSSNNWPSGDATDFITAGLGQGTVVFYGSSNYSLTTPRTFYNMEVMMSAANTLTLMSDYNLNGNLEVKTGTFKINDDVATSIRTLIVKGNVDVTSGASIRTGLGKTNGAFSIPGTMPASGNYHKIYHQFEIWGNFTNNGTVRFTNQAANTPVYNQFTNTGAVSVWFKGLTNNIATCNGTTDFYNLIIDKGTDQTYTLELDASATANFALYGPNSVGRNENAPYSALNPEMRKALWIYNGTLKLTGDLTIPTLSEGSDVSGNGDYAIGGNACLWIASANVSVYSTAQQASELPASAVGLNTGTSNQALSVYGKYRISAGTFATRNSAGLIFWSTANAVVSIEGGTTTVAQFRSAASGTGQTSYLQSGGILKVDAIGEVTNGFPLFGFDSSDGVFVMSGGEIQVLGESGNTNDVYLPISDGNYNVTGGKLTMSVNGNITLDYYSNVPFYNVDISRLNAVNTAVISLKTSMKVLNDISLGSNSTLTSNNLDLFVGENLTVNGTYTPGTNTTTFNGSKNSIITNPSALTLNKVVIAKSAHPTLGSYYGVSCASSNLSIGSDLTLTLGSFNTVTFSPNVAGNIVITDGLISNTTGATVLNGGATQSLSGSGLNFGSVTLNNGNFGAQLLTDIVVNNLAFNAAGSAKVNLGAYNLKVAGAITNSNSSRYIYGAGNASDGGLSLYVSGNGAKTYPIGMVAKYTPASMTISGYSSAGFVTVIPVNASLATTNPAGGVLMPYYWKTNYSGFTTLPNVIYAFTYAETDNAAYYPGKVLDVSPYTRSYVNNLAKVDATANTITFDTPFTLEKANYTAGASNRFTGAVATFYSNGSYVNWSSGAHWHQGSKAGATGVVPTAGSIVYIYGAGRIYGDAIANTPAEIIFDHDYVTYPIPDSEKVPRLQFNTLGTFNVGRVSGTGMISFEAATAITLNGDFGDFGTNPESYYLYYGGGATLTNIPSPIPNLLFEGTAKNINQAITVNNDFIIQGSTTVTPYQNVDIKRDLSIGMWDGGTLQFRGSGTPITMTVGRNVDFTKDPAGTLGTRTIVCEATANDIAHRLIVKGDIIHGAVNSSTFDLYNGAANRNRVVLELAGTGTNSYTRTSTAVPDFYQIVMNKGVDQTSSFTFNQYFTIYTGGNNGATKSITMQDGSLAMNSANFTNFNLTSGGNNFAIPSTSALILMAGSYTANGASGIDLDGELNLNGGSLDMSGGDNPIVIGASGASTIDVSAGTLTVGGQIRRGVNSEVGMLKYYQSGGNVYVGRTTTGATTRGTLEVMGTGSVLSVTAGDLYIERASALTMPGLYLMPETITLASGNTIHIGSPSVGSQTIGIYSTPTLQNLDVLNSCTAKLLTVPLTLAGNLSITSGVFNANGLALNIAGDFTNSGTFTHVNNTTTFNGSVAQAINGATTFYNLTKSTSNTLNVNSPITVANDLLLSSGALADNGNTISVKGDATINGTHQYTAGAGKGILLDNTLTSQNLLGSGTIGKLTINNSKGVDVPVGNLLTITNDLRLEAGVFNIDKNLLTLSSACTVTAGNVFSASNMIQTNASFTDNGVTKVFPSGASSFTYPVGAGGKYTPVVFTISANGNSTGSITVKSAAEYHPTVLDPANVLQYYWSVSASGMSGFSADATYKYESADVRVTGANTEADYIAARLLSNGLGQWTKFDNTTVDETTNKILFSYLGAGDAEVSGDYTAGINAAIPATVPRYESTKDGDWTDVTVWSLIDAVSGVPGAAGVSIPVGGPRGSIATVKHVVTSAGNGISSYNTILQGPAGNLILGTTYGHRLGIVAGTGTLSCAVGDLPASDFAQFFTSSGGTLEYNGSGSIDILTDLPSINNLKLSGTGTRRLPNIDIQLLGTLNINGPIVDNDTYDKAVSVKGNVTFDAGTYTAGNLDGAKFVLNGTAAQTIGGVSSFTGSNDFYHFELNNSAGATLNRPLDISGNLTLTSGLLTTSATNILKMSSASATASAGTNSSFVNGPMQKQITSGNGFTFPVGNATRLGALALESVSVTGLWKAQYFSGSADLAGLTTSSMLSPVAFVSTNEYWNVVAPSAATATPTLRWDSSSGVNPSETGLRGVQWITTQWNEVALTSIAGTSTAGSAKSASTISFNANAGGNYFTFGAITIPAYTWTGTTDTDWFKTTNWSGGIVPSASSNTTIADVANQPIVSGASVAQTNNLVINSGATSTLTLASGSQMTINGTLTNNGTVIIQNTIPVMASLITKGAIIVAGNTTVQSTFTKDNIRYWYYGFSITGVGVTSGFWGAADATNVGAFKFSSGWTRFTNNTTALSSNPLPGVMNGYSVKLKGSGTVALTATGTLNSGDYSTTLPASTFSLLCNPYPSAIDMSVVYAAASANYGASAIDPTYWVPTNATSTLVFSTYNLSTGIGANGGSKILPSTQAFWASNNAATSKPFSLLQAARVHSVATSLKSLPQNATESTDIFRMELVGGVYNDELVVGFRDVGSDLVTTYDSGKKLNSGATASNIYSIKDSKPLVINMLPLNVSEQIVPLELSIGSAVAGDYLLRATNLANFDSSIDVFLEDLTLGSMVDLRAAGEVSVSLSAGVISNRYVLHFKPASVYTPEKVVPAISANSIDIKKVGEKVVVTINSDQEVNADVEVLTIEGALVSKFVTHLATTTFELPSSNALYVVKVVNGSDVKTLKVVSKK